MVGVRTGQQERRDGIPTEIVGARGGFLTELVASAPLLRITKAVPGERTAHLSAWMLSARIVASTVGQDEARRGA